MKRTLKCLLVLCLALLTLSMTAMAEEFSSGGTEIDPDTGHSSSGTGSTGDAPSGGDSLPGTETVPSGGTGSTTIGTTGGQSSNDPTTINVGYRCGWLDDSGTPGTVWDTNHELGSTVTVRENMFTPPEGKEFLSWKSEQLKIYQPGDTFTAPFQTVILTAQWGDIQEPPDEEEDEEKEPDGVLTRQDIWEELSQMAGEDSNYARNWVMDIGISDGSAPDAPVSRQQLTVMLYRYATEVGGLSTDTPQDRLTAFVDGDKTDDYAAPALNWAVNEGILKGYEDQTLRVEASATSTQLGIILPRFTSTLASAS